MRIDEKPGAGSGVRFFAGRNFNPAVIAVWAALIVTANLLPAIPMVATSGTFNVGAALVPLAGIFFGPFVGALCAAIGAFISQLIAPHGAWLGMATFLISTTNAFVAGCVAHRRWYLAAAVILVGYGLWFLTPIGFEAAIFPLIFYTLGLAAVAIGAILWHFGGRSDSAPGARSLSYLGIFAAAYAGFVGAAGLANFAGTMLYKWPAAMWKGLAFVSPVERAIFSLGSAIIGIPLLIGLPKIGVHVGPKSNAQAGAPARTEQE